MTRTSVGLWVIPSRPTTCTFPKASWFARRGIAVSVTGAPSRCTTTSSGRSADRNTTRWTSLKLGVSRPSIETIRSPGWNPASAAALCGAISLTTGADSGLADRAEQESIDHDRKDEIGDRGPAHDGRPLPDGLPWKEPGTPVTAASREGTLAAFSSSMNFTNPPSGIAASRQRVPWRS